MKPVHSNSRASGVLSPFYFPVTPADLPTDPSALSKFIAGSDTLLNMGSQELTSLGNLSLAMEHFPFLWKAWWIPDDLATWDLSALCSIHEQSFPSLAFHSVFNPPKSVPEYPIQSWIVCT